VAQVARTLAAALGLNTDLAEAIALAHDLGHTPFGHTGEEAMAELMAPYGGFDHNAQALRIVTGLERHYAEFDGLNLTWETLEGIAKHNGPLIDAEGTPRKGPLPAALVAYNALHDLELHTHASAEAQVAAIADDVAYNHHDLHDGLRSGLFTEDDLIDLPITGPAFAEVDALYPDLEPMRRRHEALRRVFGTMVEDVIAVARHRLQAAEPQDADAVRALGVTIIRFSDRLFRELKVIRRFLFERMYRAPMVVAMRAEVTEVVRVLFALYLRDPGLLPAEWRADVAGAADKVALARVIADYVAGMTDRFALQEHARLLGSDAARFTRYIVSGQG
jgi:dGTPase